MFLSQTDQYALRAMVHLALQGADALVPSKELAEATHIPTHYLSKIMRKLVEGGLVISQKGHHGGFQIIRPLEDITVWDILQSLGERGGEMTACAFGWSQCDGKTPCPLHEAWGELRACFQEWAATTTLSKIRYSRINQRFISVTMPSLGS